MGFDTMPKSQARRIQEEGRRTFLRNLRARRRAGVRSNGAIYATTILEFVEKIAAQERARIKAKMLAALEE
jgi:hypothetical protein